MDISTKWQHLATLNRSGVLSKRREGAQIHYQLQSQQVAVLCRAVCGHIAMEFDSGAEVDRSDRAPLAHRCARTPTLDRLMSCVGSLQRLCDLTLRCLRVYRRILSAQRRLASGLDFGARPTRHHMRMIVEGKRLLHRPAVLAYAPAACAAGFELGFHRSC